MVFGQLGGSILLLCRNVSPEAAEVLWFQGDPRAFPPLFSSRVAFPADVRFSLVDNSSLRITGLRAQDQGDYTCREVLNRTDRQHRVRLLLAGESAPPPRTGGRVPALTGHRRESGAGRGRGPPSAAGTRQQAGGTRGHGWAPARELPRAPCRVSPGLVLRR